MRHFIFAVGLIVGLPVIPAMAQNYTDNPPAHGQYISPCHDGNSCNTLNVGSLSGKPQGSLPSVPSGLGASSPPPSPSRK